MEEECTISIISWLDETYSNIQILSDSVTLLDSYTLHML